MLILIKLTKWFFDTQSSAWKIFTQHHTAARLLESGQKKSVDFHHWTGQALSAVLQDLIEYNRSTPKGTAQKIWKRFGNIVVNVIALINVPITLSTILQNLFEIFSLVPFGFGVQLPQLSHFRGSGKSRAEFISAENLGKISHFENYGIFGIILRIFTTIWRSLRLHKINFDFYWILIARYWKIIFN